MSGQPADETNQAHPAPHGSADLRAQLLNAPEVANGWESEDGAGNGSVAKSEWRKDGTGEASDPSNGDRGGRTKRLPGEIWPDCPVKPLGVYGETSFYLDVQGQLRGIDNHTNQKMLHMFGGRKPLMAFKFPSYDRSGKPTENFNGTNLSAAMIRACDECGVWSPVGRVRGAGCWVDEDDQLVVHAGSAVLIDGVWEPPGVYDGKVYSADNATPRPLERDPRRDPAVEILDTVSTWAWRRPDIDPQLVLGVICAQMMGGALDWRPVTWLTGDRSTGKSAFQDFLRYVHGGSDGLKQASDATEAGIRSVVGFSSLPVAIDELEPDADPSKGKAANIIRLARIAASGDQIFRGSTDQKGYQSNAYSCFLFSSILVPPMPSQDRSRLILLDLDRLDQNMARLKLDPRKWRKVGAALRRRLINSWPTWRERLELWRSALAEQGHGGRSADNYGTVLALADMALGGDLPTQEVLTNWAEKLAKHLVNEDDDIGSNAEDMLTHVLSQFYDPFRRGEQWTVGQWIMAAAQLPGAPKALFDQDLLPGDRNEKAKAANALLAKLGMRVKGKLHEAELFVPNKPFAGLCKLFDGSPWAEGVWAQAARRVSGATPTASPLTLAGIRSRGFFVPIRSIPGLLSFPEGDVSAQTGAVSSKKGVLKDAQNRAATSGAHSPEDPFSELDDF